MGKKWTNTHSFILCAYGESEYLEQCIKSLMAQKVRSRIIIATSTPNGHILGLAHKYDIPVRINTGQKGLAGDWNFALKQGDTKLVTLAHQDDIYLPGYTKAILRAQEKSTDPIIFFTDYAEIRGEGVVRKGKLLTVKRLLLSPLHFPVFWNSIFIRRRILSLGSAICCPSVTLVKGKVPEPLFEDNMESNIDWQAWERLSRQKGAFVYVPRILMEHRIHEGSTTTRLLTENARGKEDYYMFCRFWPEQAAKAIMLFYSRNEKYNRTSE